MPWSAPLRSLAPLGPDNGNGLREAVYSVPSRFPRADTVTKSPGPGPPLKAATTAQASVHTARARLLVTLSVLPSDGKTGSSASSHRAAHRRQSQSRTAGSGGRRSPSSPSGDWPPARHRCRHESTRGRRSGHAKAGRSGTCPSHHKPAGVPARPGENPTKTV